MVCTEYECRYVCSHHEMSRPAETKVPRNESTKQGTMAGINAVPNFGAQ